MSEKEYRALGGDLVRDVYLDPKAPQDARDAALTIVDFIDRKVLRADAALKKAKGE